MLLAIPYSTVASDHQFGSPGLRVLSEGRIAASTNSSAQVDCLLASWYTNFPELNLLRAPQSPKLPMEIRAALGGLTITLGVAIETDLVQPISRLKSKVIGQASETDLAQSLSRGKRLTLGQALEVDLAQPFARGKARALGVVSEIDLARPLARAKTRVLGVVSEVDLSQIIGRQKSRVLGVVSETDLARSFGRTKTRVLGIATEIDLAQAITAGAAAAITRLRTLMGFGR